MIFMEQFRYYFLFDLVYDGDDEEEKRITAKERKMFSELNSDGLHKTDNIVGDNDETCTFHNIYAVYKDVIRNNILFTHFNFYDKKELLIIETAEEFLSWLHKSDCMWNCDPWGWLCNDMIYDKDKIHIVLAPACLGMEFYTFNMGECGITINTPEQEIIDTLKLW